MSQALPMPPPGFEALSVDEQIDYVQSLWDRIAARPEDVPVPDWHREILAERLAAHHANQDQGKDWEEFEKDLSADEAPKARNVIAWAIGPGSKPNNFIKPQRGEMI